MIESFFFVGRPEEELMRRASRRLSSLPLLILALSPLLPSAASAQMMREVKSPFAARARVDERLFLSATVEPVESLSGAEGAKALDAWELFRLAAPGEWQAYVNRQTGRIESVEGEGIPWIPGSGNHLTAADVPGLPGEGEEIRLSDMEKIARAFLPRVAPLLGIDPATLVLNQGRSGRLTDHLWAIDFDVVIDKLPIDGGRVVFRVSHGNLIQLGTEGLPSPGARAPRTAVSREKAQAAMAEALGGLAADDQILDAGSLHLLPVEKGEGEGRGLLKAWQFLLRRPGVEGTWRGRVDAATGQLLELVDVNDYAKVTGGVYPVAPAVGPEVVLPLPGADTGVGPCTNDSGAYTWTGGAAFSTLNACRVRIIDNCGSIHENAGVNGNIAFGTSGGTDCTTPGHGGAGNTHAARTQFYHLNRVKTIGMGWLPTNTWLASKLTVNTNLPTTCNAYWNGTSLNFFRSGGGCANSGEMSDVSFHEYGHGLDANDGNGSSPDAGTAETYGDFTTALMTHNSCIGRGFLTSNCGGYGDPCTACTGVRDIDWAKHVSATPYTVANFTQLRCPAGSSFRGPCGKEGHCESYVPSEALWDFAARDLPSPGGPAAWLLTDRLWYLSRPTATAAFSCTTGGTFTSNGCAAGSLWKTFRAIDDDDGNLANGTPHSCNLFAAFNRHGIACTTDPGAATCFAGCAAPAAPTVTLATGSTDQVQLSWTSLGAGIVYDVYASIEGCNSAFNRIANNVTGTTLTDFGAGNGVKRAYQVVAHPTSNESCGSVPSACQETTPCTTTTLLSDGFETGAPGWTLGGNWSTQVCSAHAGTQVLRFGGNTCTANYANNLFTRATSPVISVPAGANIARLSFWHQRRFETDFDGGTVAVSINGGAFSAFVPVSAILSGASYNDTIAAVCAPPGAAGLASFSGIQSTWVQTVINLDAACNAATGGTTGCSGFNVQLEFAGISDCSTTDDGWFLDDVAVSACVP
jgi:hypothetical protein